MSGSKIYGRFFFILFLIVCNTLTAQECRFIPAQVEPELIESGEYKNYYRYDLGAYVFWLGRYENNLRFKIQDKATQDIEFNYVDSVSDAMILIPKLFSNVDNSEIVILVEVAAEYSWGQEVVLIKDQTVNYLGYMNYAVLGEEMEESISDYCIITSSRNKIWLTLEDIKIIDYSNGDKILNGKEMKFELDKKGIERIN